MVAELEIMQGLNEHAHLVVPTISEFLLVAYPLFIRYHAAYEPSNRVEHESGRETGLVSIM